MKITNKNLASWVQYLIEPSFPATPEGRLAYNIVARALEDSVSTPTKTLHRQDIATAIIYLLDDLRHTWLAGVDGQWVTEVMEECGLLTALRARNKFVLM